MTPSALPSLPMYGVALTGASRDLELPLRLLKSAVVLLCRDRMLVLGL